MGVPPALKRGEGRGGVHGYFLTATPLLVLGLAAFVVALNIRHYSTMCGSDNARDEALNRAAMERRINFLENEIQQNGVLMTSVLRELEAAFEVSKLFSVEELRQLALTGAADFAKRRVRQPPPPMSEYARARVAAAVDGGTLQDLVEAAVSPGDSGLMNSEEDANLGWDWSEPVTYEDDFLNVNKVDALIQEGPDLPEPERIALCRKWLSEYNVKPGLDWGTLPEEDQRKWSWYRCDEVSSESESADASSSFEEAESDGGGEDSSEGEEGYESGGAGESEEEYASSSEGNGEGVGLVGWEAEDAGSSERDNGGDQAARRKAEDAGSSERDRRPTADDLASIDRGVTEESSY